VILAVLQAVGHIAWGVLGVLDYCKGPLLCKGKDDDPATLARWPDHLTPFDTRKIFKLFRVW